MTNLTDTCTHAFMRVLNELSLTDCVDKLKIYPCIIHKDFHIKVSAICFLFKNFFFALHLYEKRVVSSPGYFVNRLTFITIFD